MQVVRTDAHGQALLHQVLDGPHGRIHPPHEDGLVLHRDAVVDEHLAGGARLGRDLLGVVEMGDDEERRESAERPRQRVVDAHGKADRNSRSDADDLDVRDFADAFEQLDEPLGRQEERVAARDEDVPHLAVVAEVPERLG